MSGLNSIKLIVIDLEMVEVGGQFFNGWSRIFNDGSIR